MDDLIDALAVALCRFTYDPNRTVDEPVRLEDPCEEICDFCRAEAEYLAAVALTFEKEDNSEQ